MSLEHLVMPGNKEIAKAKEGSMLKDTETKRKNRAPNGQSWNNMNSKINKILLNYNVNWKYLRVLSFLI